MLRNSAKSQNLLSFRPHSLQDKHSQHERTRYQKPYCRKCKITLDQPSEYPTSCFKCKYDLCSSCTSEYEKQISQLDSSLKCDVSQKHQVGTCDKFHPLMNAEELPSKNILRWSCLEIQGSPSCLACGFDFDRNSKERSLFSRQACDFDLCSNCDKLSQELSFSCSKGHKLYIVSSLRQFSGYTGNKYQKNQYRCHCCRKEYEAKASPSCHCKNCRIDICPQCCGSYQLLSNQKEQKMKRILKVLKKKEGLALKDNSGKVEEKENYAEEEKKEENFNGRLKEKENANKDNKERKELKEKVACIVCLNSVRSHVFTPCNHLCACEGCSLDIMKKKAGCPICRESIQGTVKVFMS